MNKQKIEKLLKEIESRINSIRKEMEKSNDNSSDVKESDGETEKLFSLKKEALSEALGVDVSIISHIYKSEKDGFHFQVEIEKSNLSTTERQKMVAGALALAYSLSGYDSMQYEYLLDEIKRRSIKTSNLKRNLRSCEYLLVTEDAVMLNENKNEVVEELISNIQNLIM